MLFTFLAALAACQTTAMRPELSRTRVSQKIATIGDILSKLSSPKDSGAALQEVAGIMDGILAETGNATEHMSDADEALLREVVGMLRKSMYKSMDAFHAADKEDLKDGKKAVEECNANIAHRLSPAGDLGKLEMQVTQKQNELNRLQDVVDEKTLANATEWRAFDNHMQNIPTAPACPSLPSRTMPALDVFFEESEYVNWFTFQKVQYDAARMKWAIADKNLKKAISDYNIQKAKRDTQYCDWKAELIAACAEFDLCYETTSNAYTKVLVPRVQKDSAERQVNFKAGETIIHQIKFLLAEVAVQETPPIDTSRYEIDIPTLPPKGVCDLSVLDDAKWVPTPVCNDLSPDYESRPRSLDFSGCSNYKDSLPGKPLGGDSHTVVMEVEVKPAAVSASKRQWILNIGQINTGANHWLWNAQSGIDKIQFGAYNGAQIHTADISTGHTLATSFDGATKMYSLYVDGVFHSSRAVPLNIQNGEMHVGIRPSVWTSNLDFQGCVRGVDVYRSHLSEGQVAVASRRIHRLAAKNCQWTEESSGEVTFTPHCHPPNFHATCNAANEGKFYFAFGRGSARKTHPLVDVGGGDAQQLSGCKGGWLHHNAKKAALKITCTC